MHDLRTEQRELKHFFVTDALQLRRISDESRVRRVDAVDIGKDLTLAAMLSDLQRGGQRDRGCVGTSAAESGDLAILGKALKTADNGHFACVEFLLEAITRNLGHTRAAVHAVGDNARLTAGQTRRRNADALQCQRQQRDRNLFARRHKHVELAS